VKEITKFHLSM